MPSYGKLCTQFYDLDKPQPPQDALEFYLKHAEAARGPILEPMCGSGRFLIPLMERKFEVEGFDSSPEMLAACEAAASKRGLKPRIRLSRLEELEEKNRYGLIFIPTGSFGFVTDLAQVKECFRRMQAALLPGGSLVFEAEPRMPESSSWPWGGRWISRADGAKLLISWLGNYDAKLGISHSLHRYELIKEGQLLETEFEDLDLRLYEASELRGLLEEAGFSGVKISGDFKGSAPGEKGDVLVAECRKT